jgi:hypothetical protein
MRMIWKLSDTTWINPAQIVEVFDDPETEEVLVNYAVGDGQAMAGRHFTQGEREALLDYLNNPVPEGFV